MSEDVTIQPRPDISITIASADPILAATMSSFEQLLNLMSSEIGQAVASVTNKAEMTQITALIEQMDSLTAQVAAIGNQSPAAEIANLVYTVSQSSVYQTLIGSYSIFTDDTAVTGGATENGAVEWIQADLGSLKYVDSYVLTTGSITGWGDVGTYLVPARAEISIDGLEWLHLKANHNEMNLGNLQVFSVGRKLRYFRLISNRYLAVNGLFIRGY